ncbi:MAG: endolytic transglycosylase MltG [Pseudotabrizicola sp.]|uniref:endolytic transglycosylase MltG n=1 Tax=Pseudotabrizicola sp. TaxID=2939647 RepID=UPI0027312F0D|nr:endolytic transglycosylase MltG [Pseudotabrizicola sp.]MDP2080312.1 endolytic transglycosylase MltG [Pseudotabrizicola sp.]MDZ7572365.1 endolytic transglycosylase MltG [Pseudotabrizicola sp.]
MWRSIASNALTLFIVLLVVAAGVLAWGREAYKGPGPLTDAICFRVERGASLSSVSRALEAQGAVSDARIFRIGADYSDKAQLLKFGSYLIPPSASMVDVLKSLTEGGQSTCGRELNFRIGVNSADVILRELDAATNRYVEVVKFDPTVEALPQAYVDVAQEADLRFRVTLAEGVTSWQVVEALKRADFMTGEVAAVPPEGSLAPDSYEVDKGSDRAALLARMTVAQEQILAALWASRADGLPYASPEEALIMASIVEKETGVADERPQVASVFVNRLERGMRLQTDPTVIYGVTMGQGVLGRGIRQSELRRETPYNTYVISGLPPTPIANPGRLSIQAALNPDTTDYIFFVADGTGGHAFAVTLEDHNRNVARWREIERAQGQEGQTGVQGE